MVPTQPLKKRAKNVLVVIASLAGLVSLVVPIRIINARVHELASRRFGSSFEEGKPLSPEWQQTMEQLKTFVENTRGLKFKHEFPIVLESNQAFQDRLADRSDEYQGPGASEQYVALKALGLIDPKLKLDAAQDPLQDGGTLGYYDQFSGRMVVGSEKNTPFIRSVLVHELTHVLQDQNFGLDRDLDFYDESYTAFEALVEGDATRIEHLYLDSLSPEEQAQAAAEEKELYPEDERVDPSIEVLGMLSGFSYAVGEQFVDTLLSEGGQARLDRAFRSPPTTTEQVLHPERFTSPQKTVKVTHPKADGHVLDEGVWGERGLLTLFLPRLPKEQARAAADGWAGDYYVAWRKNGRDCMRMTIATDGKQDQGELLMALRSWAHGRPFTTVSAGKTIDLRACV